MRNMNEIFINEALTYGINSYLLKKARQEYSKAHIFELTIAELLVSIYGELNVINPFKTYSEKSFRDNLKVYGLTNEEYYSFIKLLNEYFTWLNSNSREKNNIINSINKILVKMIVLKGLNTELTNEEVTLYDNYFLGNMRRIAYLMEISSVDPTFTSSYYARKKKIYLVDKDKLTFEEIEPELLNDKVYKEHGLDAEQVKQLSNLKIDEINSLIVSDETKHEEKAKSIFGTFNVVVTSGNGFVDMLVLLSIMFTELMIGFVVAVLSGGF